MVKYTHVLEWKQFNVSLDIVKAAIEAMAIPGFCGTSSDLNLRLHFTEEVSQANIDAINAYWAGITNQSAEATAYFPSSSLLFAIKLAKEDSTTKTWDQLSAQQKKLLSGVDLLLADKVALITAFPQV